MYQINDKLDYNIIVILKTLFLNTKYMIKLWIKFNKWHMINQIYNHYNEILLKGQTVKYNELFLIPLTFCIMIIIIPHENVEYFTYKWIRGKCQNVLLNDWTTMF